jgi:hypothetical protein
MNADIAMAAPSSLIALTMPAGDNSAAALDERRELMARRVALGMARERLREYLDEVLVDLEDATQALAEVAAEQELGLPSLILGAVQARVQRCTALSISLSRLLDVLDDLQEQLSRESSVSAYPGASTVYRAG